MMRVTKSLRTAAGFATALFVLSPVLARAEAIEEQLDCKSSGHTFISALLAGGEIQSKPMRVESNSINAFRPAHGVKLTAYDYKVFVVLGYQKDDPIFAQGKGPPIANSAYGVVVTAPPDDVRDRVHQAGSNAIVHEITPVTTAVLCKSE
jgi:hypothetical protein